MVRFALVTLVLSSVHVRAGDLRGEIERAAYEESLAKGLRPRGALALLRAQFTAAADQTFLDEFARKVSTEAPPTRMKSYARVETGYDVVVGNGRSFALRGTKDGVTINGVRLEPMRGVSAYFASIRSGLRKTWITAGFSWLVPAAYAESKDSFLAVIAAQTLSFFSFDGGTSPSEPVSSSAASMSNWYAKLARVCEREVIDKIPFEGSHTRKLVEGLKTKSALPPVEDCENVVRTKIAPQYARAERAIEVTAEDARGACAHAGDLRKCFEAYGSRTHSVELKAGQPSAN